MNTQELRHTPPPSPGFATYSSTETRNCDIPLPTQALRRYSSSVPKICNIQRLREKHIATYNSPDPCKGYIVLLRHTSLDWRGGTPYQDGTSLRFHTSSSSEDDSDTSSGPPNAAPSDLDARRASLEEESNTSTAAPLRPARDTDARPQQLSRTRPAKSAQALGSSQYPV